MREDIIQNLRTYFYLDLKDFEKKYEINFYDHFKENIESLELLKMSR